MFMLSLIFVTVCLFEWKQICRIFSICLHLYCLWKYNYQVGRVEFPLTGSTPPHFCACPRPGPGASYVMVFFMFICLRWEVIVGFVDIGGIVDHHCLKLSFHNHFDKSYKTSILPFNLSIVVFVSSSIVCSSTICAVTPDIQSSFSVCFTCNFIQSVKLRRRKMGVC